MKIEFIDYNGYRHAVRYKHWVWWDSEDIKYLVSLDDTAIVLPEYVIKGVVPDQLQPVVRLLLGLDKPTILQKKVLGMDNED